MIKTTYTLPPEIIQHFERSLLSRPTPKFRESLDTFEKMWKQIEKLWKRLEANPKKKSRCEKIKQEIIEIYERAKVKEKERESQTNHKTQGFGYSVTIREEMDRDVLWRLKFGRKKGCPYKYGSNRNT